MLIKRAPWVKSSAITPKNVYLSRRRLLVAGVSLAAMDRGKGPSAKLGPLRKSPLSTNERLTPYELATTYNAFLEFGMGKEEPAKLARDFRTVPWTIRVEGEVHKPRTYDLDAVLKMAPLEERIYRVRCAEGWSVVVPWIGFPLSVLIQKSQPTSRAAFVAFQSFFDPAQMPAAQAAQKAGIQFPYLEGLRLDEAMHPLTLLSVGMYGEMLPNQNGAPIRLVVPWKQGFKSIKSIVKVRLVEKQPATTFDSLGFGFYANVDPAVKRTDWNQGRERRLGESEDRDTLPFNGYGNQVARLYAPTGR